MPVVTSKNITSFNINERPQRLKRGYHPFAFGNSSTNITNPGGGTLYVNGTVIYNSNIANNSATQLAGYSLTSADASWVYTTFSMTYDGVATLTSGGLLSVGSLPFGLYSTKITIETTGGTILASDEYGGGSSPASSYEQSYYLACSATLSAGTYRFGVRADVDAVNPASPNHVWRLMLFRSYK